MTASTTSTRRALITGAGAADGIGFAIAHQLGKAGHSVFLTGASARVVDRAAELSAQGIDAAAAVADLTLAAEVAGLREAVGAVDILINNAGMGSLASPSIDKAFLSMTEADWDRGIDVSLKTAFLVIRAFLPSMVAAGYGRIVNVASVTGPLVSFEGTAAYSAAKAGMVGLTRTLALEVAKSGITVNAVAPGPFESKMMAKTIEVYGEAIAQASPLGRIGRPDDMAGVAIFLSSRAGSYVTGAVIPVDGGIATTR